MYGSGTGQLKVHLDKDGEDVLLWQLSGEQSIAWLKATIEYQSDSQHQAREQLNVSKVFFIRDSWRFQTSHSNFSFMNV